MGKRAIKKTPGKKASPRKATASQTARGAATKKASKVRPKSKAEYTAIINFDIKGSGVGAAATLRENFYSALLRLGWEKERTTALTITTTDPNRIWKAQLLFIKMQGEMEAKLDTSLTAASFTVQRKEKHGGSASKASETQLKKLDKLPFPWERKP